MSKSVARMTSTFLYFAYGSNLLRERILVKNRTAVFKCIARLDNYRLAFGGETCSRTWNGAVATIIRCPGEHVWGCVWTMNTADMDSLDDQEGVSTGIYRPISVSVTTTSGDRLDCRSYQIVSSSCPDPRPSPQYKSVILRGAKQSGLPAEYIEKLASIEDNGYDGPLEIMKDIDKIIEQFKDK